MHIRVEKARKTRRRRLIPVTGSGVMDQTHQNGELWETNEQKRCRLIWVNNNDVCGAERRKPPPSQRNKEVVCLWFD